MKFKTLMFSIVMLSCLIALLFAMISPALGDGCGTNPLGDTSGDTEFYVSKNQNLGASSDVAMQGTSQTGKATMTLGSTATKAKQKAAIQSLNADKPGPQSPGTSIIWTVEAANPSNEDMLFYFLLKGPSTGGQQKDQTGWTARNKWTWNITEVDVGENIIEVQVKRISSSNFEDSRTQSYVITADTPKSDTVEADIGSEIASSATFDAPSSDPADTLQQSEKTTISKSKPRIAPDERTQTIPVSTGPNMNMPETTPTPLVQDSAETTGDQALQTYIEPEEPKVMQVDGKWNLKLENASSSMDLILIQMGKKISGSGTLNEKNTKIPIFATGTVSANSMTLDVETVVGEYVNKIEKSIYLDLIKVDRIISGSYEAYSGENLTGKGKATASRFGK
jgi:hypothetical protein